MSLPHKFVVLEGLDGAGTTSQLKRIAAYCGREGIPCWTTFEPSDGFIGRAARAVLEKREAADPLTLAQLFAADRREHQKAIRDHLRRGEWVFCDRYLYSSLAYQSLSLPFETVWDLNKDFPHPDICLYLSCSLETTARRRGDRPSEDIYETEELQRRVRENYEQAFLSLKDHPKVLRRIDGERPLEEVTALILKELGWGPSRKNTASD